MSIKESEGEAEHLNMTDECGRRVRNTIIRHLGSRRKRHAERANRARRFRANPVAAAEAFGVAVEAALASQNFPI